MPAKFQNIARLLVLSFLLNFTLLHAENSATGAANGEDPWVKVEEEAARQRKEAEKRVRAESKETADREAQAWETLKNESKAKEEAKISAEAESRRNAEKAEWQKNSENQKVMEKNAEDAVSVEQTNAQIATERVKTEAAAKAKADAEAQLNIEREKAAAAEKARAEVEAKLAAEREKAAATEKAKEEAEAKLAEAQGKTAAAEKARVEAEAKAAEEREKAAAAEKARVEAEAKAAEEREKAAAETKAGEPAAKPAEDKPAAEAQSTQDNKNAVAEKPAKKEQPKTERHADAAEDEESETLAKVGSALLWYIPNRLSDLMDVFTFEVGGGEIGLDLQLTRYAALGAGVGKSYMLGWSVNNQHGVYCQEGWYADILRYRVSENRRDCVSGKYIPFFKMESERVDIDKMSEVGAEDPYAIGIKACCYLNLKFQIHVTELADFVAGIFFIDFKKDDNEKFNWVFSGL